MIMDLMIQVDVVARRIMRGWNQAYILVHNYLCSSVHLSSGNNSFHLMSMGGYYDIMDKELDVMRVGCVGRYWRRAIA